MNRPMRKINDGQQSLVAELNLTPLLDLVFVLLVIFIIATPQLTNNLEMTLPSSVASPAQLDNVVVTIDSHSDLFLNGVRKTLLQLTTDLIAARKKNPDMSVVLTGSENIDYQKVVEILDAIHQINITKVALTTDPATP